MKKISLMHTSYYFLILTLMPAFSNAEKVETQFFDLDFPENLLVENDHSSLIIASGPNMKPLVVIEYGAGIAEQFTAISEKTNQELSELGSELSKSNCGVGCIGLTGSAVENLDDGNVFVYYYLANSEMISFIIVVASPTEIDGGKLEITNLANQVLSGK